MSDDMCSCNKRPRYKCVKESDSGGGKMCFKEAMSKPKYNPACKCKDCTGEGLGWIEHLSEKQSKVRADRMERYYDKMSERHPGTIGLPTTGDE